MRLSLLESVGLGPGVSKHPKDCHEITNSSEHSDGVPEEEDGDHCGQNPLCTAQHLHAKSHTVMLSDTGNTCRSTSAKSRHCSAAQTLMVDDEGAELSQ